MIGPFFYIDSDDLAYHGWVYHLIREENGERCSEFMISQVSHAELFERQFRNIKTDIEYFNFPKGRVVYNTATKSHIIYADQCLIDDIDNVVRAYKLKKYEIISI